MSVEVEEDIVEGSQYALTTEGATCVRRFQIRGLGGGASIQTQALTALAAAGVAWSAPHPTTLSLFCTSIKVFPMKGATKKVYADATYQTVELSGGVGGWVIKISGSGGSKVIGADATGKPLTVGMLDPSDNQTKYDYANITAFRPGDIIEFTTIVGSNPFSTVTGLRGTVNSQQFQGQPQYAWVCRKADAESLACATRWRVHYAFELSTAINPTITDWQQIVYFKDQSTGQAPAGIDPTASPPTPVPGQLVQGTSAGNAAGYAIWTPDATDFNQLGLPDLTSF